MERFEDDGTVTGVAAWSSIPVKLAVGTRFGLDGTSIARQVRESGTPARVDTFHAATGAIAREAQDVGIRSSVGCPIVVAGRLWGVIAASRKSVTLPAGRVEISSFTELVPRPSRTPRASGLAASRAPICPPETIQRRCWSAICRRSAAAIVSLALELRPRRRLAPRTTELVGRSARSPTAHSSSRRLRESLRLLSRRTAEGVSAWLTSSALGRRAGLAACRGEHPIPTV